MNTSKIHLEDPTFDSKHSERYDLLIRIYPKRISYAIINHQTDQLKVLVDSPDGGGLTGLKKLIDLEPNLKLSYHNVKVSVQTSRFTFIPTAIYAESELDSYAIFATPLPETEVLITELSTLKIKNIAAVDKYLRQYIISKFPNATIVSQAEPLIDASLKLYHNPAKTTISIQFNFDSFEILVLENNTMLFYNLFNTESLNEFNYFLLGVIRDLQLKSFNTDVILSGEIGERENVYKCVQKYFAGISFADSGMLIRQTSTFRDVIPHQFFSLISLKECE